MASPKLTQPEMFIVAGGGGDDGGDQAAAPKPRRGRPPGSRTDPAKSAARRRTATPKPPPEPEPPAINYGAPVTMVGAIVVAGLAAAKQKIDAWTVAHHTPTIAAATHALALAEPRVASVLEKLAVLGPYGAFFAAVLPLGVQLAHNHGFINEDMAVGMGAIPVSQLRAALDSEEQTMAAQNDAA